MLPKGKNDRDDAEEPEFEVRVIGEGGISEGGDGDDLGEVVRIGVGEEQPRRLPKQNDVPIPRLEATRTVQARAMSEVPPLSQSTANPSGASVGSGVEPGNRMAKWTLRMALGSVVLVVAAVLILLLTKNRNSASDDTVEMTVVESEKLLGEADTLFIESSAAMIEASEKLLRGYAAADSVDEVLPLVRNPEGVKPLLQRYWKKWDSDPAFSMSTSFSSSLDVFNDRKAILLSGRKGDFRSFKMIFVYGDGEMKLDWPASFGVGDRLISELAEGESIEDGVIRAVIRQGNLYTPEFPEDQFVSYRLLNAGESTGVWAFASISSAADLDLKAEFNDETILLEKMKKFPVTLKLSGPMESGPNVFTITEMLHKGWVSP